MVSLANLLELTLTQTKPVRRRELTEQGTVLDWLDEGVLLVSPARENEAPLDLLLSAGIHGNETAPIELLDRIVKSIALDEVCPKSRVLIVFGNPGAMRRGIRYENTDLNRLFGEVLPLADDIECKRALRLRALSGSFFSSQKRERLHYDLHTTIRGSKIEKFAVYPWAEHRQQSPNELQRLSDMGIEAAVLQRSTTKAFACYTYRALAAESFTIELGAARPFGENDTLDLSHIEHYLLSLIEGTLSTTHADRLAPMKIFEVSREIIKRSDAFRFHFPETIENFSELVKGTLLAEDLNGTQWRVDEESARIIFPNARVANGLRAGLILTPSKSSY